MNYQLSTIFLLLLPFFNQNEEFKFATGLFNDGMFKLAREEFINFAQAHQGSELVPDAKYFAAECLYREKQYKPAIEEFSLVKRLYPKFYIDASIRIGLSYYGLGMVDSGITIFEEIKDKSPDEACYWLGEGYFKLKKYKEAIEFYKLVKQGKYKEYALYSIGFSLLELKDYGQAISYLSSVTKEDLLPQTEFLIAKAFYEKGNFNEAILRLKKIKGKYEQEANFLLGETFYKLSKFKEAIQSYSKCETGPEVIPLEVIPLGVAGLAKSYYALKDYPKALEAYQRLLNYSNYRDTAIEGIGRIYYDQKSYTQAIQWFDQTTTYTAKLMSANAYFENGEYKEALSRYKSIYSDTNKPEPLYRMALTLYKLKEYEKAKKLLADYTEKDARMLLLLGEIAYHNEKYNEALNYYQLASKSESLQKEGWKGISASFIALKSPEEAYKIAKLIVEKYPTNDTYYEFANVAYLNKKYDEAVKFYSLCGKPYALFQAGNIYYELGKYDKSIQEFEKFLKSYPLHEESGKAKYLIALAYRKQGKFERSRTVLTELINLYPGTPLIFDAKCAIGDNFYDEGKYKEAELAYREALELLGTKYDETSLHSICGIMDSKLELEGLTSALEVATTYIERLKGTLIADKLKMKAGDMCYNEAKSEKAIEYYLLVENPSLKPSASYSIANCYRKLNKLELTIRTLEEIIENFPYSEFAPSALYNLGEIFYQNKEYEKSNSLLNKLLQKYPDCEQKGEARLQLALCYIKLNNPAKGEEELSKLLNTEKEPEILTHARLEYGKLFLFQGKAEEAAQEFNLVLESGVMKLLPEARYELGEAHLQLKEYKKALSEYLKVKYLYSENKFITPALYKAAQCEELLNNNEEAKRFYQMTIDRGDNPDIISKSKQALQNLQH